MGLHNSLEVGCTLIWCGIETFPESIHVFFQLNIHNWFPGELRSADEAKSVFSSNNKRFNSDKNGQEKLLPKSGSTASLEWDATQGQIY